MAAQLGLTEGVAVAPGSGDNQMSALGAGAVREGAWVVSLGTSGALGPSVDLAHNATKIKPEHGKSVHVLVHAPIGDTTNTSCRAVVRWCGVHNCSRAVVVQDPGFD